MGGNTEYIAGHGYLSLSQAVHVAQNSEGGVDQRLAQFLEKRLAEVWSKLNAQPQAYILPSDEFALLNYYRTRFGDNEIVRNATKRFWDNHKGVTSAGRQFDRLGLMFLNDTEVFRTSTAEPTQNGIIWSYVKDMSSYLSLFKQPQKIIFDLGNLIDDTYTGSWNTTLTATFFTDADAIEPADVVIPISARRSADDSSSAFTVPDTRAMDTITLPRNAKKAVFSIAACGQATEEFWWSNVLSSDTTVFGNETTLYGHSAFRELRLLIDGQLAGVVWPFPVIFTGGIVPGFWRPVVGIDAFDLQEDEIDITSFIPMLNDNEPHTFEIEVVGIDDDGSATGSFTTAIGSNWVVTGKIFIWLDADDNVIAGSSPRSGSTVSMVLHSATNSGTNSSAVASLDYSIQVNRSVYIESIFQTDMGAKAVTWKQDLAFSNVGTLSNKGNDQVVRQSTTGTQAAYIGYSKSFEYPLWVKSSYKAPPDGNVTIDASMERGKHVQQVGDLAFPNDWKTFDYTRLPPMSPSNYTFIGSDVSNSQNGTASYLSVPAQKKSYGSGTTEQHLTLSGLVGGHPVTVAQDGTSTTGQLRQEVPLYQELYRRNVIAANNSVVYDDESYGNQVRGQSTFTAPSEQVARGAGGPREFAKKGVRALLGRGPA
ncbi:peptide-n4-(n-acetyl-beta-glucosaminyl)asparagine amidase a [Stemphylium lycopersici]|nr:peptide-n4-(n-acetyl-beta-glucosaminyl)asparagine amidase a [Stemphylium lycopersici]